MPEAAPLNLTLGTDHLLRLRRDPLGFYEDMQARHGDAVRLRLGPYRLWLLFHPGHVEAVMARQAGDFIRFERLMRILRQWNGENVLTADGPTWHARRRHVLPVFATRHLPDYAAIIAARSDAFDARLRARGEAVALDVDAEMGEFMLDVALTTMFGATPPRPTLDAVGVAVRSLSEIAYAEATSPLILPDVMPLPAKRRKRWALETFDTFVRDLVTRRLDGGAPEGRRDLLATLVEGREDQPDAIRDDVVGLLIAGHETSGAALSWAFALLAQRPDLVASLRAEIAVACNDGPVGTEHLRSLPRLAGFVREVLRLYPPAYTMFLRRAVRDVAVDDLRIRARDVVQLVPWVTHRDARWFPDPLAADPDRWRTEPQPFTWFPFGAGPRVCIGQSFGMLELTVALATLLRGWTPRATGPVPKPVARFSLRPEGGLPQVWERVSR
ncbi:cytochrome P450 [Jannaschia sp. LMIT008]|uniref:cytochrome P450 n=1 Tax=Jannaschia maritima TaxID=3032585 RepID=UPI002810DE86|nr:cytochrome P450 [Jannaschia sp. LMIT008]